jgi:hypothetical protein
MVSQESAPQKFIDPFHLENDGVNNEKDIMVHLFCLIVGRDIRRAR